MPGPEHIEAAELVFHVDSPFTVDLGRWRLTLPEQYEGRYRDDRSALLMEPGGLRLLQDNLKEDLSGLLTEIAGPEFTVSGVRFRSAGSFEIVVVVVAAYEVLKNAVEVVETLGKVVAIGRRLVRGALTSFGLQYGRVETRMRLTAPASPQTGLVRQRASLEMRLLVALVASNFLAVAAVLAVLILR